MASQITEIPPIEVSQYLIQHGNQLSPILSQTRPSERLLSGRRHARQSKVAEAQARFIAAMEKLKQEHGGARVRGFEIRDNSGWGPVFATTNAALEQYESKRKGFFGRFRRADVMIGRHGAGLSSLVELLPCGDYTSIASGGVKLILAMCKRKADQGLIVRKVLGDAPECLESAETFIRLYPEDKVLSDRTDALYIVLLRAIEAMAEWLTRSRTRVLGQLGSQKTDEHRDAIDEAVQKLEQRAVECDRTLQVESHEMMTHVVDNLLLLLAREKTVSGQIAQVMQKNDQYAALFMQRQKEMETEVRTQMGNMREDFRSVVEALLSATKEAGEWRARAIEVQQLYHATVVRDQGMDTQSHFQGQWVTARLSAPPITAAQLVDCLRSKHDTAWELEYYSQECSEASLGARMSKSLIKSAVFVEWLAPNRSDVLMINPTGSLAERGRASPGSFVVAALAQTISEQRYAVVLTHFCGQHQFEVQVADVLASLLSQLLQLYAFDFAAWSMLSLRSSQDHVRLASERNLAYLCELFEHLVNSVALPTVYILIDELWLLECSAEEEHLEVLTKLLARLQASSRKVKVLFMQPESGGRGLIAEQTPRDKVLDIDLDELDAGIEGFAEESHGGYGDASPMSTFIDD